MAIKNLTKILDFCCSFIRKTLETISENHSIFVMAKQMQHNMGNLDYLSDAQMKTIKGGYWEFQINPDGTIEWIWVDEDEENGDETFIW